MRNVPLHIRRKKFIDKCILTHGTKYVYTDTIFTKSAEKVEIRCPKHGCFTQLAQAHAAGHGCPHCDRRGSKPSREEFINRAVKIHGDKYGYDSVEYIDSRSKVTIKCHSHGCFEITPSNHLQGSGCKQCGFQNRRDKGFETFITRAATNFGTKYDYSRVVYNGAHSLVEIVCPRHGVFNQTPVNHYQGHGCSACSHEDRVISGGEARVAAFLDERNISYTREQTFQTLRNPTTGYPLRFDFYLKELNTLIEFDGEHHFAPIRGDLGRLARIEERDEIKNIFAKENGFSLIRIRFDESVHDVLTKFFPGDT